MADELVVVKIDKLVFGGQGLGILPDGRKCFVWGALPGEQVAIELTKKKKDWAEGITKKIIEPSKYRVEPKEPGIYLATSPWQVVEFKVEAIYKQEILKETFEREHVDVNWQKFYQDDQQYGYRNKMEYNFWWDNDNKKVSLALHQRGSRQKVPVNGSLLASDVINIAGEKLIDFINQNKIQARNLKSVIIRCTKDGKVGLSIFITKEDIVKVLSKINIGNTDYEIIFSNPKSPASVATKILHKNGDSNLSDKLMSVEFKYHTRSFFQVNLDVYRQVLKEIVKYTNIKEVKTVLDLYSGVGSIGLSVIQKRQTLTLVESDIQAANEAKDNAPSNANCEVINAKSEKSLDYLAGKDAVIVDPPRAGLHKNVVQKLIELKPKIIIYLSCNPATQARDMVMLLGAGYLIKFAKGYNFFPRTPHIECLIVLEKLI
ncbi:MAG: 23S rRNA (uracil(1939)-C(5))-methyltransferase RlmD [Candidatus Saccharibacteria bacterium]